MFGDVRYGFFWTGWGISAQFFSGSSFLSACSRSLWGGVISGLSWVVRFYVEFINMFFVVSYSVLWKVGLL